MGLEINKNVYVKAGPKINSAGKLHGSPVKIHIVIAYKKSLLQDLRNRSGKQYFGKLRKLFPKNPPFWMPQFIKARTFEIQVIGKPNSQVVKFKLRGYVPTLRGGTMCFVKYNNLPKAGNNAVFINSDTSDIYITLGRYGLVTCARVKHSNIYLKNKAEVWSKPYYQNLWDLLTQSI